MKLNSRKIFQYRPSTKLNSRKNLQNWQSAKLKFSEWYTQQVDNALQAGVKVENINIEFKLTTIKPLHAKWIVDYYNHITSEALLTLLSMMNSSNVKKSFVLVFEYF